MDLPQKVGNAHLAKGKLDEALTAFRAGLAIAEHLAAADRRNTEWQRDLSISYGKLGNVLVAMNNVDDGLKAYRDALAIQQSVSAGDLSNTMWQRDLSISHGKIGNVLQAKGRLFDALTAYRECLGIRERLAAANPSNKQAQRDLARSVEDIGGLAYRMILDVCFPTALEVVDQAISLAPEEIWLYASRAHALMFLDRLDEARTLYLKYWGQKAVQQDKSWEATIRGNFAELRKAGLMHRLMQEIEKQFAGS